MAKNISDLTRDEWIAEYVKGNIGRDKKHGNWFTYWYGGFIVLAYEAHGTDKNWISSRLPGEYGRYEITDKVKAREIVAYRNEETGQVIFNANELEYAGRSVSYGYRRHMWGGQNPVQELIEKCDGIPLPFNLFEETGFDIRDFDWVLKPVPETVTENIIGTRYNDKTNKNETYIARSQPRHFAGACIFTIDRDHYLFDIDRQEIQEHKIFNAFIVKLPAPAVTIKEAYDLLMPGEVKKAIAAGTDVKRQGEYFFIRVSEECPVKIDLTDEEKQIVRFPPSRNGFGIRDSIHAGGIHAFIGNDRDPYTKYDKDWEKDPLKVEFQKYALKFKTVWDKVTGQIAISGDIGKGSSASHKVEKFVKIGDIAYVSGTVTQSRRQHGDLILSGWYKVVPNTAVTSWTISGKID
jgi:hypothetical protein